MHVRVCFTLLNSLLVKEASVSTTSTKKTIPRGHRNMVSVDGTQNEKAHAPTKVLSGCSLNQHS